MLLAIDIGNTNITLGLYDGETLGPRWRLATDHNRMPDEYGITLINLFQHAGLSPKEIDGIALASVVPPLLISASPPEINRLAWLNTL